MDHLDSASRLRLKMDCFVYSSELAGSKLSLPRVNLFDIIYLFETSQVLIGKELLDSQSVFASSPDGVIMVTIFSV